MSNALIYGNGKSRLEFNPQESNFVTWGCNRIYREKIHIDNLVAVDYIRQHEIYSDGYAKDNVCWFSDWHELPKQFIDKPAWGSRHIELLKLGFDKDNIFRLINGPSSNLFNIKQYDTILYFGDLMSVERELENRREEIIPIMNSVYEPWQLVNERAVTVDTTASGGNANLLAL